MSSSFLDLTVVKDAFDIDWNRTWVFVTNLDVELVVESKSFQECNPTCPPVVEYRQIWIILFPYKVKQLGRTNQDMIKPNTLYHPVAGVVSLLLPSTEQLACDDSGKISALPPDEP